VPQPRPAFGLAGQELADQVFQHHGRLRLRHGVAGGQVLVVAAGLQADVLVTQQAGGQDLGRGVLGELEVAVRLPS
jgi:hypothetical protein